ncbi:MAG: exodeoxyribonuclease VII small subunit [Gemmatimonadota bacterium]|jgi:exodeoxyribonuclease VII small subunit|nr:exodeoxyribonuclease VII small subunit [Gemmatimonadota bacterium]
MAEKRSLEEALGRLDEITRSLEGGGIELDRSLALYEEGIQLVRLAEEAIRDAEMRIERLNEDGGLTELKRVGLTK